MSNFKFYANKSFQENLSAATSTIEDEALSQFINDNVETILSFSGGSRASDREALIEKFEILIDERIRSMEQDS